MLSREEIEKMDNTKKKGSLAFGLVMTLILTAIGVIGLVFHEPWYEEAQPYLVARDASWYEVIFVIPHYEGHPPLWHMLIKLASIPDLSFELTVKAVQFIFFEAMILMLELRSPFGKVTNALVPLSFFIIYHYCVLSRPYAMLMFAGLLCASFYVKRREKPVAYILSLAFLCLCHSYGIAFAGGIAAADITGEIIRQRSAKKVFSGFISNKRLLAGYIFLLAAAIAVIADIAPRHDTMATHLDNYYSFPVVMLLCIFFIPSEVFVTSFSSDASSIQTEMNSIGELIGAGAVSVLIWAVLFIVCKKRRMLAELIIPYIFISIPMSIYAYPHHYGMFLLYALFIMWTAADTEEIRLSEFISLISRAGVSEKFARNCVIGGVAISAAMNVYWDVCSYAKDIRRPYDSASSAAEWIKEQGIQDRKLLIDWSEKDTNIYPDAPVTVNAYFDHNLYYNMEGGVAYVTHIMADDEEIKADCDYARSFGAPDFIVCSSTVAPASMREQIGFEGSYIAEAYAGDAVRPFKDKVDEKKLFIICTKETYKELYGKEYEIPSYKTG